MKEPFAAIGKKITDIKILKNKIVIYFNKEKIEISPETFTEFRLYINKRLEESHIKDIVDHDQFQKYLNYALKLAGQYVYTNSKLKRKLIEKGVSDIVIKKIIDYLNEHHIIDDKAVAKELARDFLKRLKGPHKIMKHLEMLGIKKEIILEIIKDLNEKEIISNLIQRIKALDKRYHNDINKRTKIIRALVNEGYALNMIEEIISTVKLSSADRAASLKHDYQKFARQYKESEKIIKALKRKGYHYSEIKTILKEKNHDFY